MLEHVSDVITSIRHYAGTVEVARELFSSRNGNVRERDMLFLNLCHGEVHERVERVEELVDVLRAIAFHERSAFC